MLKVRKLSGKTTTRDTHVLVRILPLDNVFTLVACPRGPDTRVECVQHRAADEVVQRVKLVLDVSREGHDGGGRTDCTLLKKFGGIVDFGGAISQGPHGVLERTSLGVAAGCCHEGEDGIG